MSNHIDALRVVLDEYKDSRYVLGVTDCCTLVADYLTQLGHTHTWDRDSERDIQNPIKALIKHLGKPKADDGLSEDLGDIILMERDETGPIIGLRTGRGIVSMFREDGLIFVSDNIPVRGVWRVE